MDSYIFQTIIWFQHYQKHFNTFEVNLIFILTMSFYMSDIICINICSKIHLYGSCHLNVLLKSHIAINMRYQSDIFGATYNGYSAFLICQ